MKNLSVLFLLVSSSCVSYAQDVIPENVPSVVVNTFHQKFPKQTQVEWGLKKGLYEAEFEINALEHNVYLDSTGNIVKHKEEVAVSELPVAITNSIQKNFSDYTIDEAKKIQTGSKITYKLEIEKGSEERKVTFDSNEKIESNNLD